MIECVIFYFVFSSRRRHTRYWRDWSSGRVLFRSAEGLPELLRLKELRDLPVVVVHGLGLQEQAQVPRAEKVLRLVEVPLDELAAPQAVLVAGVFEKAVEARGHPRLDALELPDHLGQGAPHGERVAVPERYPVVPVERDEPRVVVEVAAGEGEELAVGVRHQEQGGARVEGETFTLQAAQPAAALPVLLESLDLEAYRRQPDRRRQPAHAAPAHRNPPLRRRRQGVTVLLQEPAGEYTVQMLAAFTRRPGKAAYRQRTTPGAYLNLKLAR